METKPTTKKATNKKTTATAKKDSNRTADTRKTPAKKDAAEQLEDFFIDGLKDIYWAEKALTKALPKMAKNATSQVLQQSLNDHLSETEGQIKRLEEVFELMGKKAQAVKCDAMDGLINEGNGILEETQPGAVRDAGIIAACQKIEHYEIATYGTLCAHAKTLGKDDAAKLLHETLEEEKNADLKLTEVAYNDINFSAV